MSLARVGQASRAEMLVRRIIARFLDAGSAVLVSLLVVSGLEELLSVFEGGEAAALIFGNGAVFLAYTVYEIVLTATRGQTVGKMVARVEVRMTDGSPPRWRASALRYLPLFLLVIPGVGWVLLPFIYLPVLINRLGRGMHDSLAGTHVVDSQRPGTGSLFDRW